MDVKHKFFVGVVITIILASPVSAQEKVYYDVVQKIMEFEFANSHVMENSNMLTNIFGGRFSKTPAYRAAADPMGRSRRMSSTSILMRSLL